MMARTARRRRAMSPTRFGATILVLLMVVGVAAFQKDRIASLLGPGDVVRAEFARQYKLVDFQSKVKLAGVVVGEITGAEKTDADTTMVSMRVDPGVVDKLGATPSAAIRPTLLVGGVYEVSLTSGGRGEPFAAGDTIPVDRTTLPVELDAALQTLTPPARDGIRTSIRQLDGTLNRGGDAALKQLAATAPDTLAPTGEVLTAARGTEPATDLQNIVVGLENLSAAINKQEGQFGESLESLATTSESLAAVRTPLAKTIHDAPETLRTTREGLTDLQPTLDRLIDTAPAFRPSVQELSPLLAEADPVLERARPVVADLNRVLIDARPLVERLNPTVEQTTEALHDVEGPVLDRLNGPVLDSVRSPWTGTGVYEGGGNDHPLYEELAYLTSAGTDVFKFRNQQGGTGRLMAGVGANSVTGGAGNSLEQYLEGLGMQQPMGPQDGGRAPESGVPGPGPNLAGPGGEG